MASEDENAVRALAKEKPYVLPSPVPKRVRASFPVSAPRRLPAPRALSP